MLSLLILLQIASPAPSAIKLDGGSIYPASETVTYNWACPDGRVTLEVVQTEGSVPKIGGAFYGGTSIAQQARTSISAAIKRFRTVESISPRCLTGGGIWLLFGGLFRDEIPSRRHVVSLRISRTGQVSVQ